MALSDSLMGSAALLGAAAAIWKWVIAEIIQVRGEIPAVDASLNASVHPLREGFAVIDLTAACKNRGSVPLFADLAATEAVALDFTDLEPTEFGRTASLEARAPAVTLKPLANVPFFVLEPGTDNEIGSVFVVATSKTYLLRFTLWSCFA